MAVRASRAMPGGRVAIVFEPISGRARLGIGPAGSRFLDGEW